MLSGLGKDLKMTQAFDNLVDSVVEDMADGLGDLLISYAKANDFKVNIWDN
jgi:hypothetical protein